MSLNSLSWSHWLLWQWNVYEDMMRAQARLPGMRKQKDKDIFTARTMKSLRSLVDQIEISWSGLCMGIVMGCTCLLLSLQLWSHIFLQAVWLRYIGHMGDTVPHTSQLKYHFKGNSYRLMDRLIFLIQYWLV